MDERVINILLVDDDEVDVMTVKRAFARANISNPIFVATNGLEALEMLRKDAIPAKRRIVLLDINMPKMNGIEFLRELRADPELQHVTVVAWGRPYHVAIEAADELAKQGIECEVIDPRTLRPLDHDTIVASVKKTNRCVVVHEDHRTLGIGAEVSAILAEEAFDCLDAPITRVAAPDVPAIPFSAPLEKFYMPSVENIVTAIQRTAEY